MSDNLKQDTSCPVCGKRALCVFHTWKGETVDFEYHHLEDVERESLGLDAAPCILNLPYEEGQRLMNSQTEVAA